MTRIIEDMLRPKREYIRVPEAKVPEYQASGWEAVGGNYHSEGMDVLMMRPIPAVTIKANPAQERPQAQRLAEEARPPDGSTEK